MISFAKFLTMTGQGSVKQALQGNRDENDEEDLMDLFTRMGSHCLLSKDNIQTTVFMSHKTLLLDPKLIINAFHSSIHNAVIVLCLNKCSIIKMYESKRSTNKKVAKMIRLLNESQKPQEQTTLNERSTDQRRLYCCASAHVPLCCAKTQLK